MIFAATKTPIPQAGDPPEAPLAAAKDGAKRGWRWTAGPSKPAVWPAVRLLPPRIQRPPVGVGAADAARPTGPAAVGAFLQLGVVVGAEGSQIGETVGLRRGR